MALFLSILIVLGVLVGIGAYVHIDKQNPELGDKIAYVAYSIGIFLMLICLVSSLEPLIKRWMS